MVNIKEIYSWEIETEKGTVYTKGNKFDSEVVRISFLPKVKLEIVVSDALVPT